MPFLLPPVTESDVQRELALLRTQLAEVRRARQDEWMDRLRAEEIREMVAGVLHDSSTRVSEAPQADASSSATSAGPTLPMRSVVGADVSGYTLRMTIIQQVRFVAAFAYGSTGSPYVQSDTWGFENRRTLLVLSGALGDPTLTYLATLAYQAQTDRFVLVPNQVRLPYARIAKDFGDGWAGNVGIVNVPWDVESNYLSTSRLTTGEYSVFNYRFGVGKQPGAAIRYRSQDVSLTAGTYSQLNVATRSWDWPTNLAFAVAARGEWKIGSSWSALDGESSMPGDAPGVVLGAAVCWSNGRAQNPQPPVVIVPPPQNYVNPTPAAAGVTVDVRVPMSGAILMAQAAYMRDPIGSPELGWYAGVGMQGSAFVTDGIELFSQACWMDAVEVSWIAQAGVNLYFAGTRAKLTLKSVVPFGGGWVNGLHDIAGGLGIAQQDNNASFMAQLQLVY